MGWHLNSTWRLRCALLGSLLSIGLLTSCGSSKVSQCNQLITIVNRTSDDLSTIQTNGKVNLQDTAQMTTELETFVGKLTKNTEEMQSIGVSEPLKPLKDRLVGSYQTALKNSKALTTAIKTKDQPTAQTALNQLSSASASEAQLLQEVRNYCQAPEPK
jgi:ABC-type transporter Mla subunit MlaD